MGSNGQQSITYLIVKIRNYKTYKRNHQNEKTKTFNMKIVFTAIAVSASTNLI